MLLEVEVLVPMERARRIPPRKAAVRERMKAALRQASVSEIVVGRENEVGEEGQLCVGKNIEEKRIASCNSEPTS